MSLGYLSLGVKLVTMLTRGLLGREGRGLLDFFWWFQMIKGSSVLIIGVGQFHAEDPHFTV